MRNKTRFANIMKDSVRKREREINRLINNINRLINNYNL